MAEHNNQTTKLMMQLLNHLDRLGTALDNYSFEELKIAEALKLKQHYSALEERLHKNIFGPLEAECDTPSVQVNRAYGISDSKVMSEPDRTDLSACWSELERVMAELKDSKLDPWQEALVERLQQVSKTIKATIKAV